MENETEQSRSFILIVEDDRANNKLEAECLRPLGMEIRAAYTAGEGLAILKNGLPELMLLDYTLPDMNALDLLAELKNNGIETPPYIVITGQGDEELAVEIMKSGAQDYIVKGPALFDTLLSRAKKALETASFKRKLAMEYCLAGEERDKFKLLFDKASDAVFVSGMGPDGMRGNFIEVNDIACARLGYTREKLLTLSPAEITDDWDTADQSGKNIAQALKSDGRAIFNSFHRTKDGRRIPVEISSRIFDYKGEKFLISLARNITKRRLAETALKENVETKSKFASMVSHELRSPMSAITLGLSLILDEADHMSAEHKDLLELVRNSADRLGRLINDVLDFQKMTAGKMVFNMIENDLSELIRTTVRAMDLLARNKGLDIEVEIEDGLPFAVFDNDKIVQVLTNLLSNAIAYTDEGTITVRAALENGMLHVSVLDTGLGIKTADLHRLFQPFEQLDSDAGRKIGGTGLGLTISKEIILAHKGKIWAESEQGKGSVFHFTLPATAAEAEHGV